MANTFGIELVPHSWGTGIALHAAMHVIANLDPVPGRRNNPYPWMELGTSRNYVGEAGHRPRGGGEMWKIGLIFDICCC